MRKSLTDMENNSSNTYHDEPGFYRVTEPGFIRIGGADRIDFLQRQTTNDMTRLIDNNLVETVLTAPTARILDVLTVFTLDESTLGILTLSGRGEATTAFLRQRIFFQDDVNLEDASSNVCVIETYDPRSCQVISHSERIDNFLSDLAPVARVLFNEESQSPATRLVVPVEHADTLAALLVDMGLSPLTQQQSDIVRVENGIPGTAELTEDYTPLETNLRYAIADGKGCYTGQEVIARQITYDKVTRQLMGVRLSRLVEPGSKVKSEGRSIGAVTSVVDSPRYGLIGLAIVASKHVVDGSKMQIEVGDGEAVGELCSLPF